MEDQVFSCMGKSQFCDNSKSGGTGDLPVFPPGEGFSTLRSYRLYRIPSLYRKSVKTLDSTSKRKMDGVDGYPVSYPRGIILKRIRIPRIWQGGNNADLFAMKRDFNSLYVLESHALVDSSLSRWLIRAFA